MDLLRTETLHESVSMYLSRFAKFYPNILDWYSTVAQELQSGRRRLFVALDHNSDVSGLAITKNSQSAKLCHISVSQEVRGLGVGKTLMSLALQDMLVRGADEIRVTTSEEVFGHYETFFKLAGFSVSDWENHRYRKDASEVHWSQRVPGNRLLSFENKQVLFQKRETQSGVDIVTFPQIQDSAPYRSFLNSPSTSSSLRHFDATFC